MCHKQCTLHYYHFSSYDVLRSFSQCECSVSSTPHKRFVTCNVHNVKVTMKLWMICTAFSQFRKKKIGLLWNGNSFDEQQKPLTPIHNCYELINRKCFSFRFPCNTSWTFRHSFLRLSLARFLSPLLGGNNEPTHIHHLFHVGGIAMHLWIIAYVFIGKNELYGISS